MPRPKREKTKERKGRGWIPGRKETEKDKEKILEKIEKEKELIQGKKDKRVKKIIDQKEKESKLTPAETDPEATSKKRGQKNLNSVLSANRHSEVIQGREAGFETLRMTPLFPSPT